MNAIARHPVQVRAATPRPLPRFVLLLRREFWEHKGRFLWAPVIIGAIATLVALITATALVANLPGHAPHFAGRSLQDKESLGILGDILLYGGIGLALAAQAFMVFFYSAHCLYNDRRDRSILFWKSLPVSDAQTVLSKAVWALLLAPLIAIPIGIGIGLAFAGVLMLAIAITGGSGILAILAHAHPAGIIGELLLALPVQILWSLPAVGWLMLCSAWSRREPILWAVMLPVLGCGMVSLMEIFPQVEIPHAPIWYTVVYRGLLSVFPGSWVPTILDRNPDALTPENLVDLVNLRASWQVLEQADVWIGALLGIAMLTGAILLRRRRDEG